MERLILASQDKGMKNYLQTPYLLQIDFFAINDQGLIEEGLDVEILPPKRIPIRIQKVDAKVSPKGAEYKISIQPYQHSAYDLSTVSTPANFEITATTVAEFFQSIEGTAEDYSVLMKDTNDQGRDPAPVPTKKVDPTQGKTYFGLTYIGGRGRGAPPLSAPASTKQSTATAPSTASKTVGKTYSKVTSYGTAINAWQKLLRDRYKMSTQDTYRFEFDPEIGDSAFVDRLRNAPKDTPMAVDRAHQLTMKKASAFGTGVSTYNTSKAIFQVNAGTTVEKLLDSIIGLSDYTLKQVATPDDPAGEYDQKVKDYANEPFKFHKVVTTVELGDFDEVKKVWARTITYHVKVYKMYNLSSTLAPQGTFENPVKSYNYIYTGKNDDILDFNIEFNALYFNAVTAYRDNLADTTTTNNAAADDYRYQNAPNFITNEKNKLGVNTVMPLVMKPIVANPRAQATGGPVTSKEIAARDMIDTFMIANKADMLNVKLKILGDPDYIKQDDLFYGPEYAAAGAGVAGDDRLLPNGSLHMDNQEIYVQLLYKTPVDFDESQGLMEFDSQYVMSVFSGMYKIMKISNTFAHGQFTQELDLVRLPRQKKFDNVNNTDNKDNPDRLAEPTNKIGISNATSTPGETPASNAAPQTPSSAADAASVGATKPATEPATADAQPSTEQKDLMKVNETAKTAEITPQNQPPATQPPPVEVTPISEKLPTGVTQNNVGVYQYKGINIGRTTDAAGNDSKNLSIIANAIDTKTTVTYTWSDPVSGLDKKVTYNGATGKTESIK
jgi:hypothetical protein